MNMLPNLEKAQAYLHLQLSRSGPQLHARSAEPFVTVSREAGAGGSSLARKLADELNATLEADETPWTIFDGNIVEAMLDEHHYSSRLARFLPEDSVSEVHASVGELVGLHPNLWDLTQKTNALIRKLAQLGRCILIGRGSNFATADLEHGVHVRLVGSPAFRARQTATALGISQADAAAQNMRKDVARRRYVRATFNRDIDNPAAYDLVINTEHVTLAEAMTMVAKLVHARKPITA
jgi:cytidylate kinase